MLTHGGLCNIIFHVADIGAGHTEQVTGGRIAFVTLVEENINQVRRIRQMWNLYIPSPGSAREAY